MMQHIYGQPLTVGSGPSTCFVDFLCATSCDVLEFDSSLSCSTKKRVVEARPGLHTRTRSGPVHPITSNKDATRNKGHRY